MLNLFQVFSVFIQKLPLRDDFQENEAVINSFFTLYQQGNAVIKKYLSEVIKVSAFIYYKNQTPNDGKCVMYSRFFYAIKRLFSEVKNVLVEFLRTVNRDFPNEFGQAVSSLGDEATESVSKLFFC